MEVCRHRYRFVVENSDGKVAVGVVGLSGLPVVLRGGGVLLPPNGCSSVVRLFLVPGRVGCLVFYFWSEFCFCEFYYFPRSAGVWLCLMFTFVVMGLFFMNCVCLVLCW